MTRISSNIAYMRFFTLIAAVMVAGCSSTSQTSTDTTQALVVTTTVATTTTTTKAPTTTIDPNIAEIAEIEAVVRRYLFIGNESAPGYSIEGLEDVATGAQLEGLIRYEELRISEGATHSRNSEQLAILRINLMDRSAHAQVCFLDDAAVFGRAGEVIVPADTDPYVWGLNLVATEQGWRVESTDIDHSQLEQCEL